MVNCLSTENGIATLSTFAKNMLFPPSLCNNNRHNLAEIGVADFDVYQYRHNSNHYRADSVFDVSILLQNIQDSLRPILQSGKKPLLLLSDGKDSMALAVALSEMGVSCETLTFLRNDDIELKMYVESVTSMLGHRPRFVDVSDIVRSYDKDTFINACKFMDTPVLDQAFFFFLFGIKSFFSKSNISPDCYVVIDGLGNDEYLGYLPSRQQYYSFLLSGINLWKIIPKRFRSFRWYIRSPSESNGDLSALSCFFPIPYALNLNEYFSKIPCSHEALGFIDFRAFSRGSFHDHQCMMGKTIASAKCFNTSVYFPWLDSKLSEYCFNLPISEKFDFSSRINKLPLRKLLHDKIGWNQTKRGVDLYYDLDFNIFRKEIFPDLLPQDLIFEIDSNIFLPEYVKKRAYLELMNFYGYCHANGLSDFDIRRILKGS